LESLCPDLPCPKMPSKNDGVDFILGGMVDLLFLKWIQQLRRSNVLQVLLVKDSVG
jgi:hypothetical protein